MPFPSYHQRIKIRKDVVNLIGKNRNGGWNGKKKKKDEKRREERRRSFSDSAMNWLLEEDSIIFSLPLHETKRCYYQIFCRSVQQTQLCPFCSQLSYFHFYLFCDLFIFLCTKEILFHLLLYPNEKCFFKYSFHVKSSIWKMTLSLNK